MTLTDAQRELLEDKFVLWERASRQGSMELRDYNRRAAEALKTALCIVSDTTPAWLIEWPATRQDVVRYWHPTEGRVIDPNHTVRFARREDAEAMLKREHLFGGARAVEHMWIGALSSEAPPLSPSEASGGNPVVAEPIPSEPLDVERLREAVEALIFGLETTDACLRTWNGGKGGPADVEAILALGRLALSDNQGGVESGEARTNGE